MVRAGISGELVEDVILGCVTQVEEQAMNIARTAALTAGFPIQVPGTTIDRQCGSSQQAVHFASQAILSGRYGYCHCRRSGEHDSCSDVIQLAKHKVE